MGQVVRVYWKRSRLVDVNAGDAGGYERYRDVAADRVDVVGEGELGSLWLSVREFGGLHTTLRGVSAFAAGTWEWAEVIEVDGGEQVAGVVAEGAGVRGAGV